MSLFLFTSISNNKTKNNRLWLLVWVSTVVVLSGSLCAVTAYFDPYFHYHKPHIDKFFYTLDNQRSQNDGIIKNFDYEMIITGTSMTENFKTSEADALFGCRSIKVPYEGGSFKEINDNLKLALASNPNIKIIIRSLDSYIFVNDKDDMRTDLGVYPTYLYDANPINDIEYLLNRDVIYKRIWGMVKMRNDGMEPGITSFDNYSNWMKNYTYGPKAVRFTVFHDEEGKFEYSNQTEYLTEEEKRTIRGTVEQNITSLADQYPNTVFCYFFPPYSSAYWGLLRQQGKLRKQAEIEEYALSLIVPHHNIHMYGWDCTDLVSDYNNYKDYNHYAEWVNSWILKAIKNEEGRITEDNYKDYMEKFFNYYIDFDYNTLFEQEDYEDDYYQETIFWESNY